MDGGCRFYLLEQEPRTKHDVILSSENTGNFWTEKDKKFGIVIGGAAYHFIEKE